MRLKQAAAVDKTKAAAVAADLREWAVADAAVVTEGRAVAETEGHAAAVKVVILAHCPTHLRTRPASRSRQ